MRHISIKWRMTIWFSLLMIVITALMLVFVMLMNRNQVTRPPAAEVVRMVQRNADDVEYDHGAYDFSDVEFFGHGVYTEIFDADGRLVAGSAAPAVTEVLPLTAGPIRTAQGSDGAYYVYDLPLAMNGGALWVRGTISANAKGSVMEVIVPLAWSVLPALVLLSVAGGWLISSLSFKPMEKVIAAAASISGGEDLSRRIGLPRGRSEINRLAGAFVTDEVTLTNVLAAVTHAGVTHPGLFTPGSGFPLFHRGSSFLSRFHRRRPHSLPDQ